MKEEQYSNEPPIWMQNMMEWMMQFCQQPPTGRQAWVENDSYPIRGYKRTKQFRVFVPRIPFLIL
jgi:hypothetical protein